MKWLIYSHELLWIIFSDLHPRISPEKTANFVQDSTFWGNMRKIFILNSLANIYWITTIHKLLRMQRYRKHRLIVQGLNNTWEDRYEGNLVYCGKDYDRDLHKISWEHKEGMYLWMSVKDFTDDVMPHLNHLDFNKALEIIPNIFVVKISIYG